MPKNKKKITIANWKMRLSPNESVQLAKEMKNLFSGFDAGEAVICPSLVGLSEVKKVIKGSPLKLGVQNVFWEEQGEYTGEVSPNDIIEVGCEYAIIGHSERRKFLHENYEMIHQKVKAVLNKDNLVPIVCIGEDADQRKHDKQDFVLVDQLQQALGGIDLFGKQQIIVAYEPVWAIGSGVPIEPQEAEYAHKIIKLTLKDMFGLGVAHNNFRVVYGGSVSSKNVKDFSGLDNIDGLLVGGASLDADEFFKVAEGISS